MENRYYEVQRENVYVGGVIKVISGLYRYERSTMGERKSTIGVTNFTSFRTMLFTTNEKDHASDLKYNSPHYPVFNITSDEECLNLETNAIAVKDACCLGPLLTFAGFSPYINYSDILAIKRIMFSRRRAFNNEMLMKLCSHNELYYEYQADLEHEFQACLADFFSTREDSAIFCENIQDFTSRRNIFLPHFIEEPKVKRLSLLPKDSGKKP